MKKDLYSTIIGICIIIAFVIVANDIIKTNDSPYRKKSADISDITEQSEVASNDLSLED